MEASPLDSVGSKVTTMNENSKSVFEAAEKLVSEAIDKEKDMPVIWEPTLLRELHDVEVVDVACGLDHSLVLCSKQLLSISDSYSYDAIF